MGNVTGSSVSQKSDEIAEVIKEILLSAKPHLRYVTNKKCFVAEINAKLVDPTGDKLQNVIDEQDFFGMKSEWKKKKTFYRLITKHGSGNSDFELEAIQCLQTSGERPCSLKSVKLLYTPWIWN